MRYKPIIVMAVLTAAIIASFCFPKNRYQSMDIISYLELPLTIKNWSGKVIQNNDEELKSKFTFINKSKQFIFSKKNGEKVYFSLLNAGNFHNPRTCYTAIGYKTRFIGTHVIKLAGKNTIKVKSYLMSRQTDNYLTIYWMCIDRKKVDWLGLKINELICSLSGRKSINLLTRIDVPTDPNRTEKALTTAENFIFDLSETLDKTKTAYIFGS